MSLLAAWMRAHEEKSYIRYGLSGCFNTGFTFALYSAGVLLGLDYLLANFIAWASGVVVSFLLTSLYVFRTPVTFRRLPAFVLSNLLSLLASSAILSLLVRAFFVNPIAASVIAIPVVVALNFLALKYVVFR